MYFHGDTTLGENIRYFMYNYKMTYKEYFCNLGNIIFTYYILNILEDNGILFNRQFRFRQNIRTVIQLLR